ncbi:MAG: biosynthetic arginine decarboxylase [Bryobacterales bacterium]|nr:biosynthetic arginine decarboxylase [Bryobacterales bacterium]
MHLADQPSVDASAEPSAIERVSRIYGLDNWGFGYFGVNQSGHLSVTPHKIPGLAVDVYEAVQDQVRNQLSPPFLLRFPQILDERLASLHQAFATAIAEFDYAGRHIGAYPVKVNQRPEVLRRLVESGQRYDYGLEVGSKAELIAALSMPLAEGSLIICNGLKDDLYLRLAMAAAKLGRKAVIVVEDLQDLHMTLKLAGAQGLLPPIGLRVKLGARGSGKWEDSCGEFAKFGMSTMALVRALDLIREWGAESQLTMLHFHIGSQVNDIRRAKQAFKEAARVYAKARKAGFDIAYLNVGGGLGVDYDGSRTASEFSMNYSVQEFANDIVYTLGEVCDSEEVSAPTIVTEHGRAMVAYHSMLVTDVRKVVTPGLVADDDFSEVESEAQPVLELVDIAEGVNAKNFRERYHDAVQQRGDMNSLFELGYLGLRDKAKGEALFWKICRRVARLSRQMKHRPKELQDLDQVLASKFVCNFSMFQSIPDFWAFDQLFPIVPIHRLNEIPSERGVLCDITCDSDGTVDRFVDAKHFKESLELHAPRPDEPYYLGILLLGAYQETLGDIHNLFGTVTELNVAVASGGRRVVSQPNRGDNVRDVLSDFGYEPEALREALARRLAERKQAGLIGDEDEHEVLATSSRVLDDYTYLV